MNGGRTAASNLAAKRSKKPNSRRQRCRALDTLACFRRLRTLTIYLGISLCNGRLDVVLILPPLAKFGIDQLLTFRRSLFVVRFSALRRSLFACRFSALSRSLFVVHSSALRCSLFGSSSFALRRSLFGSSSFAH